MADAWDDEDFEAPPLPPVPGAAGAPAAEVEWDDEEDFEPPPVPLHGEAPKLSAAKAAKARDAAAARRNIAIDEVLEEGETENERARRLQQEIEDADAELAAELYSGAAEVKVVASLEGYALKSLKDHVTLAYDVAERMENAKSKANFQSKLVRELLKKIEDKLTIEDCDEIIGSLSAAKAAKEQAKKQPTAKKPGSKSKKPTGKSKKELKAEQSQHADLFGGFVEDEFESFEQEFDDFM